MLNTASLSLDQAPPISIPFRFFLTAPLFAIAAGVEMLVFGDEILLSRWSPLTIGLTHLITLGVLAMVMCGAMLQMLPVIAGSPVPRVVLVGTLTHLLLVSGTLMLKLAFLTAGEVATLAAVTLLGAGFSLFIGATAVALWRVVAPDATILGMRLAIVSLAATLGLGIAAATGFSGITHIVHLSVLTDIHLGWGMFGWVGLLLLSVSFQLIPMFQVTPEYPIWIRRWLPISLFSGLGFWLLVRLGSSVWESNEWLAQALLALVVAGFVLFSLQTLRLQHQRKRRISDITLLFWRLGMVMVGLSALLWFAGSLFPQLGAAPHQALMLGILMVQGVALSLINGMLYKIVPFLSWFHLQNRQMALMCMTVRVPHMKELLSDRLAKGQFYLHLVSLLLLVAAAVAPEWLLRPAALLFVLSNLLLLYNLAGVVAGYRRTFKLLNADHSGSLHESGGTF